MHPRPYPFFSMDTIASETASDSCFTMSLSSDLGSSAEPHDAFYLPYRIFLDRVSRLRPRILIEVESRRLTTSGTPFVRSSTTPSEYDVRYTNDGLVNAE